MQLAALFLFLFSLILTLAPAVRVHSWQAELRFMHWLGFGLWLCAFSLVYRQVNRRLEDHDPFLLPISALLSGWGLLTIYRLDNGLGLRQTLWLLVGLLILVLILRLPRLLATLRRYKYIWLTAGLLLTGLTFLFGTYPAGSGPNLWLGCCGVYFQPSEPLKLLLIIYLAAYLADQIPISFSLGHLLTPTLLVSGSAALLLIAQRDLGTASLMIVLYTLVVYMASGKRRILATSALTLAAAALAGYWFFDVIRLRVDAWVNPWIDPANRSFQIVQSLISVAAGRLIGTGPGLGSPGLVPVAHSDFIAAAIAEESGVMGLVGLLVIIAMLSVRGLQIGLLARSNYQRFLASGIAIYFTAQAILILGGNLRLLPLTGVTLPFVSYGGSSLATSFISLSLLLLISVQDENAPLPTFNPRPYVVTGGLMLAGLAALALLAGWWSVFRSDDLLGRPDNVRWMVNSRFVPRGSLLDRRSQPLAITTGQPGSYTRELLYTPLSTTIGYANIIFGRAGLESSLDSYLTGLQGNSTSSIWLAELLYSQPPPGLDVRLSLDLDLQQTADQLLTGRTGALVLLNAATGEILALASHPYYDPNQLEQRWQEWTSDPEAPLVNRATQGQYPPGTALAPFLYAKIKSQTGLPVFPSQLSLVLEGQTLTCALPPASPLTWETAIEAGCPAPIQELSRLISTNQMRELFRSLGFYANPDPRLPVSAAALDEAIPNSRLAALGRPGAAPSVSPLQMALAAAALTNDGIRPSPRLAISVATPHQGRVVLPAEPSVQALVYRNLEESVSNLASTDLPTWQSLGVSNAVDQQVSWYVGGTLPQWQGPPLAIALVLEDYDPWLARSIGQAVLRAALQPAAP